jgi:hypothetical protein
MTGRHVDRDCIGPEKARRVRERLALKRYPVICACGDTRGRHRDAGARASAILPMAGSRGSLSELTS